MATSFSTRASAPRRGRGRRAEKPFRDELLSSARLEDRALALAAHLTVDGPAAAGEQHLPEVP